MAGKPKTPQEINSKLNEYLATTFMESGKPPNMKGLSGQDFIACGLSVDAQVFIEGDAGDFFCALNGKAKVKLTGNALRFAGDTMGNGLVFITGDVGEAAGYSMSGGTLVVHQNAGPRTGQYMRNGTIIVEGTAGTEVGYGMYGGEIVICGEAGKLTGEGMVGGTIYVRGEVLSIGKNARKMPITELDKIRLKDLFKTFEMDYGLPEFVKVVPREEGSHDARARELFDRHTLHMADMKGGA